MGFENMFKEKFTALETLIEQRAIREIARAYVELLGGITPLVNEEAQVKEVARHKTMMTELLALSSPTDEEIRLARQAVIEVVKNG